MTTCNINKNRSDILFQVNSINKAILKLNISWDPTTIKLITGSNVVIVVIIHLTTVWLKLVLTISFKSSDELILSL